MHVCMHVCAHVCVHVCMYLIGMVSHHRNLEFQGNILLIGMVSHPTNCVVVVLFGVAFSFIGFCFIVPKNEVNLALEICFENGFEAWKIGKVVESSNNSKYVDDVLGIPN